MADEFAGVKAMFERLKGPELEKAQRTALRAVGDLVLAELKAVCPVQAGVAEGLLGPGQLRDSLAARVHVLSDEKTVEGQSDNVVIGPTTQVTKDVTGWLEYGHAGPMQKGARTPPLPFVRPTQDATEAKAREVYESTMTEAVTAIAKGNGVANE